jgi:hypothetical protein
VCSSKHQHGQTRAIGQLAGPEDVRAVRLSAQDLMPVRDEAPTISSPGIGPRLGQL